MMLYSLIFMKNLFIKFMVGSIMNVRGESTISSYSKNI